MPIPREFWERNNTDQVAYRCDRLPSGSFLWWVIAKGVKGKFYHAVLSKTGLQPKEATLPELLEGITMVVARDLTVALLKLTAGEGKMSLTWDGMGNFAGFTALDPIGPDSPGRHYLAQMEAVYPTRKLTLSSGLLDADDNFYGLPSKDFPDIKVERQENFIIIKDGVDFIRVGIEVDPVLKAVKAFSDSWVNSVWWVGCHDLSSDAWLKLSPTNWGMPDFAAPLAQMIREEIDNRFVT